MAFLYVPNGVHMPGWTPRTADRALELPPILEPLEAVKNDLLVVLSGRAHTSTGILDEQSPTITMGGKPKAKEGSKDSIVAANVLELPASISPGSAAAMRSKARSVRHRHAEPERLRRQLSFRSQAASRSKPRARGWPQRAGLRLRNCQSSACQWRIHSRRLAAGTMYCP